MSLFFVGWALLCFGTLSRFFVSLCHFQMMLSLSGMGFVGLRNSA
jgi:hypothetical protein